MKLCFVLFFLAASFPMFAQDRKVAKSKSSDMTARSVAENLDSVFSLMHQRGQFNGNVLAADKGFVIFKKSYGYADMKSKRKLDDESMFELASVSKQFTAMAILQLMESGKLSLADSLRTYFPELSYHGVTI